MKRKQNLKLVMKQKYDIEEKINLLKQKLKQIHNKYLFEIFCVLSEIFKLRKEQISSYTIADVSKEKGIDYTENQIRYMFGFAYMSEKSKHLISQNKISPQSVLTMINSSIKFREHDKQDKIVEKYLSGEITMTDVSELGEYQMMQVLENKEHMSKEQKVSLQATYNLKGIARRLSENVGYFKDNKSKKAIRQNFNVLKKVVDRVTGDAKDDSEINKMEEVYFCPYCKHMVGLQDGALIRVQKIYNKGRNTVIPFKKGKKKGTRKLYED